MHKVLLQLPTSLPPGPSPSERLALWLVAADGSVQAEHWSLAELLRHKAAKAAELVVLLPMHSLSWHRLTLPPALRLHGDARLLPMLQNLLEEQLLDEPQTLHIALQPQAQAGQPCLLAACQHPWLHAWMQHLERAGLAVSRVLPQLPPELLQAGPVCLEHAHQGWLGLWHADQPLVLPLDSALAAWLPDPLPRAAVRALPAAAAEATRLWGAEQVTLLSEAAWAEAVLGSRWNLAQHGLAAGRRQRLQRQWRTWGQELLAAPQWRSARWAALALALVAVLGLNARWWWHSHVLARQQQAVQQAMQQAFPNLQVIIDAPLQMQRELRQLRLNAAVLATDDLQPLLAAAGAALHNPALQTPALAPALRPGRLEYTGHSLVLGALAPTPDAATLAQWQQQLQHALSGSGYRLEQPDSAAAGAEATFTIRPE